MAAAVRCDYAALARIASESTTGFRFGFGPEKDAAAYWRRLEEVHQEPVLRRMVQVLGLAFVHQQGAYAWPSARRETGPTAADLKALEGVYPPEQLEGFRKQGSYLGLRLAITDAGEWLFATCGD